MSMVPDLHLGVLPEGKILAGISGGADSTALMLLLAESRDCAAIVPEAVHVNHHLRGIESEEDEAYCVDLCRRLDVPLHVCHANLHGKTDEDSCRRERFAAFSAVMRETGAQCLALGHNQDDLAETFLMRLLRGAGPDGLACITPVDQHDEFTIYRPLLYFSRSEIRTALQKAGIAWREDSTNIDEKYFRNSVRKRLLPLLETLAPGASERIARTARFLDDDRIYLQGEADKYLKTIASGIRIDAERLQKLPKAIKSRVVRQWWNNNAPKYHEHSLNAQQTADLMRLADVDRGTVNLPGGFYAVKGKKDISLRGFTKELPEIPYNSSEIKFGNFLLRTEASKGNYGDGITEQEMPKGFLSGCVIRTFRPGDIIHPFGMKSTKKMQDYFTDRHIDQAWREEIPLICRGKEVLFAAGVGVGAVPRWDISENNVRIIWDGEIPWKRT